MVVHTATEVLLLKRADHAQFWQSVTGSLEWQESAPHAAARELEEETGIAQQSIRSAGVTRRYSILPEWQHRYHPNARINREHLYYCRLDHKPQIKLSPDEHTDYQWLAIAAAKQVAYSWSNRLALSAIDQTNQAKSVS